MKAEPNPMIRTKCTGLGCCWEAGNPGNDGRPGSVEVQDVRAAQEADGFKRERSDGFAAVCQVLLR